MAGSTAATAALDPAKASFLKDILPLLEDHCYACHGDGQTKGGLALDESPPGKDVHHGYKIWEQIRKLVAAGEMPPEGRKNRPDGKERDLPGRLGSAFTGQFLPDSSTGSGPCDRSATKQE